MENASAHYNDTVGTAAADWHDPAKLHELAAAAGIDTTKFFPVGVGLFGTNLEITKIFAIDMENIPTKTFDGVRNFIDENPDEVKAVSFPVPEEFEAEIAAYVKNMEVVLASKGMDLADIDFEESEG